MRNSQKPDTRQAVDRVLRRGEILKVLQGIATDESLLAQVRHAMQMEQEARDALRQTVSAARAEGISWREIGEALYVSRQAAQQHFG